MDDRLENAITLLTEFIVHRTKNIEFKVVETTTNNYEEFKEQSKNGLEISSEGCKNSIYGNAYINILARVWHDDVHLLIEKDFSLEDEIEVCEMQIDELLRWYINTGRSDSQLLLDTVLLIEIDIKRQREYYEKHKEFVENQMKFVKHLFKKEISIDRV